jgi:hypothetical protein
MTNKLLARIAFSGEPKGRDIAAAAELRQAGYQVFRIPDKYRNRLAHPLDNGLEAVIDGADENTIKEDVNAIVAKFGGRCVECGRIEPGYTPFADLFEDHMQRLDRPDGFCLHCQQPANQYYPVGPIVITITAADSGETHTHEFCNWRCLGHWAAEAAGGDLVIDRN